MTLSPAERLTTLWSLTNTESERELLYTSTTEITYQRDEYIFSQGQPLYYFYFIESGSLKLYEEGIFGRKHIISILNKGHIFGIRSFFSKKPALATAIAYEQLVLLAVPTQVIAQLLEENTRIAGYFLQCMARELEYTESRLITLTQKHLRGRLADCLCWLIDFYGFDEDGSTMLSQISRSDMATLCNMSPSNMSRTLTSFAAEQVIALTGRKIRILDPKRLRLISQHG